MRYEELLIEEFETVTLSEPHSFKGSIEQIIIQIDNLFFRVVLSGYNIWWGIVPKTNTRNQIPKNSGIMKVLVPALKKAIRILITRAKPNEIEIESKTNKGRDLYRTWKNIHPDYKGKNIPRGIQLIRKDNLTESSDPFDRWFAGSKIVDPNGNPLPVYHGTDQQFDKFNFENATQRIIWFSSDRNKIEKGESGAASSKIIRTAYLKITNPAGWEEYDKLVLDQIEHGGWDGIILDDDYIVFSPEQVWLVK